MPFINWDQPFKFKIEELVALQEGIKMVETKCMIIKKIVWYIRYEGIMDILTLVGYRAY